MRPLLIATSNPGKLREISEVLGNNKNFELFSADMLNLKHDVVEYGETFEENADIKAEYYFEQAKIMTLAEDSGIIIDALKNQLGVKTRRWGAGEKATDQEWIDHFLKVLKDVPPYARTARFVCCAVLIDANGEKYLFKGETEGFITQTLEAPIYEGLPISSCFIPTGFDKVYAALTIEEKNRVSHRGKAMHAVKDFLEKSSSN